MNTASQNIRYLRRKYQFTQEQMAQKLGIKRSLLGAYEEARANPRLEVLVKAAELFNVSVDQLVSKPLGDRLKEIHSKPEAVKTNYTSHQPNFQEKEEDEYNDYFSEEKVMDNFRDTPAPQQTNGNQDQKRPYLPPRKIEFPSSNAKKSLREVRLVLESEFKHYFYNAVEGDYLETLPELTLPLPSSSDQYRAFEVTDEAMQPVNRGAIVVGRRIESIQNLKDGKPHILITRTEGVLFRRVFNHISRSGNLLLEANNPGYERINLPVLGKEVEAWEVALYIAAEEPSQQSLPTHAEAMDLPRLTAIVLELQQKVMKLKENQ